MKILANIEGANIILNDDGSVEWTAKLAIDNDGSDNRQGDPYWQPDTTLHYHGRAIDSEAVPGIVVPPVVVRGVKGIVFGCQAKVTNLLDGTTVEAVVFDLGPKRKLGEGSPELARRLGVNPSAINGGADDHIIYYKIWPGVPAIVDGVNYDLQSFRG